MARPLTQQTLEWLHRVLLQEYRDVNRTYSDVASVLQSYPSLAPRTNVYTYENGQSELLLNLHGTVPTTFRSAVYNIPVSIWISHEYPYVAPFAFVTPTAAMSLRPGNHVDTNGRVYHPYISYWNGTDPQTNILGLCAVLCDIFGKEPPVYGKPQQQQLTLPSTQPSQPLQQFSQPSVATQHRNPFSPGPHTARHAAVHDDNLISFGTAAPSYNTAPNHSQAPAYAPTALNFSQQQPPSYSPQYQQPSGPAPVSHLPQLPHQQVQHPTPPVPQYQQPSGPAPVPHLPQLPNQQVQHPTPPVPHLPQLPNQQVQHPTPSVPQTPHLQQPAVYPPQTPSHANGYSLPSLSYPAGQPLTSIPPRDIIDESPPTVPSLSNQSAPALPPHPEQKRLLNDIAAVLQKKATEAQPKLQQQADHLRNTLDMLRRTEANLASEQSELTRVSEACSRNKAILKDKIRQAEDAIIEASQRGEVSVDEIVCAEAVVFNQLYELAADDLAIEDTIYVLGKALDRERISLDDFLKHARTLAREQFMKRALVRKIALDTGLSQR
ncbi:UEV domain-containing protein [Lipomyces doorenjongii]|uniref:UEV domain-containing protein n=1 Tax=Lipomyces doorenjongii TaxID=383834 RepID=UPI0034CDA8FA